MIKKILKKILPNIFISKVRSWRKDKRFAKRFSYNHGKSFFKTIHTEGSYFDILLDPYINSGVDENIAEHGTWEPQITNQIKKILKPDSIFIDIGANIGYHSLFAATILQNEGKIYSFEPQISIYNQFCASIQKNNFTNIETYNIGLSDHQGEETLYVREENSGGSTLLMLPKMESFHIESTQKVPLVTLDSYIHKIKKIDLIKIDVEGYELEVFKGGKKMLESYHPIILMEFSPVFYIQDHKDKPEQLIDFLKLLGYHFYCLDEKELDLESWIQVEGNRNSQIDIICKYKKLS